VTSNVILIADDEPWQRMWITQMLHNAGYTCSTVSDGESVVEQALALVPGLIILDIEMPGVNGIAAAEQLRVLPNTRNVPILFVTSYSKARDLLIGSGLDQVEWMMKPFHPEDLLARVRRMMR
jgi:DNA-binding response OmpR family regulator